jgi:hypothetical protein
MRYSPGRLRPPLDAAATAAAIERARRELSDLRWMIAHDVTVNRAKAGDGDASTKCDAALTARKSLRPESEVELKKILDEMSALCAFDVPVVTAIEALDQLRYSPSQASRKLMCEVAARELERARAVRPGDRRPRQGRRATQSDLPALTLATAISVARATLELEAEVAGAESANVRRRMRKRHAAILVTVLAATALAAGGPRASAGAPAVADSAPDVPMLAAAENVASYTLRAKLDPLAHTVHGEGTITWKNASTKGIDELWMHLYLNAFKNQSSVFMRAPIGGFRGATVPSDWGTIDLKKLALVQGGQQQDLLSQIELSRPGDEDETDARVPLPRAILPNEAITLAVEWDDKLPSIVERTGYDGSFHMVAQWFPKIARLEADGTWAHFPFHHLGEFYADYGEYDVTLDVPEGFVVGATGPVTETKSEAGRHIERRVQGSIHDFAWTAWDKFQVRKETIAGVDVTVLTPPGYADHAERELETMRFALPHYGARYGKYAYPVLTLVHPPATAPEAGGMEYPTLITTGQPSWLPRGLYFVEAVTIHEFGHQYFYGLCASNEDAWPFLDEGLNSYAEAEAMTAWKGPGSGLDFLGLAVGESEAHSENARRFGHDEKVAQSAAAFATGSAYGALVYSRTAVILETLARVYGKPKMDRALGVYTRRFRFKHPTPDDLLATIRAEIGPEAADNLRVALFDKGWVDYAITQMSSHSSHGAAGIFDRDGKRETVTPGAVSRANRYDGWALVVRRGTLKFPVEIELVAEDGTRTRTRWDGEGDSFRVPYSGSSPLRAANVDPDDHVLLDEHPDDNFATAAGHATAGAPRVLERATFWAETLLGGLAP